MNLPVQPWRKLLREEMALPSSVLWPVESWALARLAACCAEVLIGVQVPFAGRISLSGGLTVALQTVAMTGGPKENGIKWLRNQCDKYFLDL